jgi:hypothetical protein
MAFLFSFFLPAISLMKPRIPYATISLSTRAFCIGGAVKEEAVNSFETRYKQT